MTLAVLLIGSSVVLAYCKKREDDRPADVIFHEANELARAGEYYAAVELGEIAGEKGSLCAMELVAELTQTKIVRFGINDSLTLPAVEWAGQNSETSKYWAEKYVAALQIEAEKGNTEAMKRLAEAYRDKKIKWDWSSHLISDDNLAAGWMKRAAEAGDQIAMFLYAASYVGEDNRIEKERWYREAALHGVDQAYLSWASTKNVFVDPQSYFEVISLAIDSGAVGIHKSTDKNLKALRKQAELGDELAVEWLAIVDSLQLQERLESLAKLPLPENFPGYQRMPFCPDTKHWRFP